VQESGEYMLISRVISQRLEEFAVSLLENGADSSNWFDQTPLGLAAEWGNEKLVKLLLDKGANANAPPTLSDNSTHTIAKFLPFDLLP